MTARSRSAGILVVAVACAAGAFANRAALRAPLELDDVAQRAMIEGKLIPRRNPLNLYDFVAEDNRSALLDRGAIPWWSDPKLVTRFLRPLSSALVWLDYRLFGYESVGPHALSLLWWAAAVISACVFYRTVLEPHAALVATAVFALSPSFAIPLVWAANRNVIVTLTFGSLAMSLYARWRADRRPAQWVAVTAAFVATALSGEYALCLIGYLVAFEVCRVEAPRRRVTGTLPAVVPLAAYVIARAALGYGARASGLYRDPMASPVAFLEALPRVFTVMISASWLGVDVTSPMLESQLIRALVLLGAGAVLVISVRNAPGLSGANSRTGAWLACGSILSIVPLTPTEPSRRLLGVAALGVSGLASVLLSYGGRGCGSPARRRGVWVAVGAVTAVIHLVAAPLQTRRLSVEAVDETLKHLTRFTALPYDARGTDTTLVLRATDGLPVLSAPYLLRDEAPQRWRVLSHTFEQTKAIRLSPSSIEVTQDRVPLFPIGPTGIVRTTPFAVGDVTRIAGMSATVLRVDPRGSPLAVRYDFDRDLDNPGVAWISEGRAGFADVDPHPPVGFGVELAP